MEYRLTLDTFKRELSYSQLQEVRNNILEKFKAIENTKCSYSWATYTIIGETTKLRANAKDEQAAENAASEWLCYFLIQIFVNDDKLKQYRQVDDIKLDLSTDTEKQILDSIDISSQYHIGFCSLGIDKVSRLTGMWYLKPIVEIYLEVNIWKEIYKMIERGYAKTKDNARSEKLFPRKYKRDEIKRLFELLSEQGYITNSDNNSLAILLYYCGFGGVKPDSKLLEWNAQNNELAYLIDNLFGSRYWSVAEKIFGVHNLARAKSYCNVYGTQGWKDGLDSLLGDFKK